MSIPIAVGDVRAIAGTDVLVVFAEGLPTLTIGDQLDAVQRTVFETEGRLLVDVEVRADSLASSQTGSQVSVVHLVAHTDIDGQPMFGGRAASAHDMALLVQRTGAVLLFLCGEDTSASATAVHAALGALQHEATVIGMPWSGADLFEHLQPFVRAFYKRLGEKYTTVDAMASFTNAYFDIFDSKKG